jgi:hypothetical protein
MAFFGDVCAYLRPTGGWVARGSKYENIEFMGDEPPFSKADYEAAFAIVDQIEADKAAADKAAKQSAMSKLAALGLTADDLKALGL